MIKLWPIIILCWSSASGAPIFFPALNETTRVSFDSLQISRLHSNDRFGFSWDAEFINKDSVVWTIDGVNADPAYALIAQGNSPDKTKYPGISRDLSSGAELYIQPQSFQKYSQGIHSVGLTATYRDTVITATWKFKMFRTRYREFLVTAIIDRPSCFTLHQPLNTLPFRQVLSVSPMDTTLLSNASCEMDLSAIYHDTAGIYEELTRKGFTQAITTSLPVDTSKFFVLQITRCNDSCNEWVLSQPLDSFIRLSNPTGARTLIQLIPLNTALAFFNTYAESNHLPKGYCWMKNDLRIGPVLSFGVGDPGWFLSATFESPYWYFNYRVGSGDCPTGCTLWQNNIYRISQNGIVENVTTAVTKQNIASFNRKNANQTANSYNLRGQLLRNESSKRYLTNNILLLKRFDKARIGKQVPLHKMSVYK